MGNDHGEEGIGAEPPDPESSDRFHLYGRRRGRPLRSGRQDLLETLLPQLQVSLPPDDGPLDPALLFERRPSDVWLEIGFGSGEHLATQAAANPDIGLIGCEPFLPGVASLLSQLSPELLGRIRLVAGDARPLLWRLGPGTLGRAFVLFPDPWRKTRHHRRRIVSRPVLDRLALAMRPGAELRVATDDAGYLRWILAETLDHPDFEWIVAGPEDWRERPPDWPPTRYERKALRQGRRPAYLRFRRRPDAGPAGRDSA